MKKIEKLSYEEAFAELETVLAALENEGKTLDETLALFERGQALSLHCEKLLENAELRVKQLTDEGRNDE